MSNLNLLIHLSMSVWVFWEFIGLRCCWVFTFLYIQHIPSSLARCLFGEVIKCWSHSRSFHYSQSRCPRYRRVCPLSKARFLWLFPEDHRPDQRPPLFSQLPPKLPSRTPTQRPKQREVSVTTKEAEEKPKWHASKTAHWRPHGCKDRFQKPRNLG